MIVEIFSLLALCISVSGWGKWLEILFKIKTELLSVLMIFGLITVSVTAFFTALFFPLDAKAEAVFLVVSIIPFFLQKRFLPFPKEILKSKWFWFFCLILLLAGSYRPFLPDHFGYYIPTLNWLNEYGLIKGLANIDWTFGQMSFYHIIQAGFDNILDVFQRLNIFIGFIFLLYIFEKKAFTLLLFLPFSFLFLQSPSPDLPVVLFSLMVVNEMVFVENNRLSFNTLLLISIFVFIIKPIAFWLPLWVFIMEVKKDRKSAFYWKNYLFPTFLIALFIAKNVYCASVLFYPVTSTSISTSWLPYSGVLEQSSKIALLTTYHFYFTLRQIADFSLWQRIYHWFLSCGFPSVVVHCLILLITLIFAVFSWKKKRFTFYALLFAVALKLIFVFWFSGQYRFMLDGVLALLFILLSFLKINYKKLKITSLILCLMFLFLLAFPFALQKTVSGFNPASMLKTADFKSVIFPQNYELKKFQTEKIGNLEFNISTQYRFNFDTPPPAVTLYNLSLYHYLGVFPQKIDSTDIHQGFYMKKLSPTEKNQLDIIIQKLENEKHK